MKHMTLEQLCKENGYNIRLSEVFNGYLATIPHRTSEATYTTAYGANKDAAIAALELKVLG